VIQCGAVLAVVVIFTARVKQLLFHWREPANLDYLGKLMVAFVITGIGGVLLEKGGFRLSDKDAAAVAWATLVGGVAILVIEQWLRGKPAQNDISWVIAVAVGLTQLVAAAFPGTSRSGITILAALALGSNRIVATEFSFLLGIPTLLAAGGLKIVSAIRHPAAEPTDWGMLLLGTLAAAVIAFAVVQWLLRFVRSHTFVGFGWYRIALGVLILILYRAP